jgi:hypothetical protein
MHSNPAEHFCTLFDSGFLPFGLTLWSSLEAHAGNYHLWILCMDQAVEEHLRKIALPHVSLIPVRDIETPDLLAVKPGRGRGEYCWTVTPFIFNAVLDRAPEAARVTYLDADLFFFASPAPLLAELEASGKSVLITDHAYDPRYDRAAAYGRFCVQFNTFGRDEGSQAVNSWWRERCLEWCFNREEDGKFGDQKYLDGWPEMFPETVHVLKQTEKTLAPWNVRHSLRLNDGVLQPVFFHFHGFRPVGPSKARLYDDYNVGPDGDRLYDVYLAEFAHSWKRLRSMGIEPSVFPIPRPPLEFIRDWVRYRIRKSRRYGNLAV